MEQELCEPTSHCPATKAADILGDKWVLLILRAMILGARRYSDFSSAIPKISPSVLSGRLKQLCEKGLIVRRGEAGSQATYRLAPSGREAEPIIAFMAEWGLKWAQRHTSVDQLDVGGTSGICTELSSPLNCPKARLCSRSSSAICQSMIAGGLSPRVRVLICAMPIRAMPWIFISMVR